MFKARDKNWDTPPRNVVALKSLRSAEHAALHRRAAGTLASLQESPGVLKIYDHYEGGARHPDLHFLVLEYVEQSADALLQQCPNGLRPGLACSIACSIAKALHHAHELGLIHRDIKPGNILVDPHTLRAKIGDFGIAWWPKHVDHTESEIYSGTPPYLAPEQRLRKEGLTRLVDVWQLGCTLFELHAGRANYPHQPATGIPRFAGGQAAMVALSEYRPDLPAALISVVEKAIAWREEDRIQSCAEFAGALQISVEPDFSLDRTVRLATVSTPAVQDNRHMIPRPHVMLAAAYMLVH